MSKSTLAISAGVGVMVLVGAVLFFSGAGERSAPAQRPIEVPTPMPEAGLAAGDAVPTPPEKEPEETEEEEGAATPAIAPSPVNAPDERPRDEHRPEKMGPVDELKAAYERDTRDNDAGATEARIREQFKQAEIPEGMLRRVSCVKSACKLELRWTVGDSHAYMIAMMGLVKNVSQELGAVPVGADEGQQVHSIDVYVSRIVPSYEAR
jgi:hypothetical protein